MNEQTKLIADLHEQLFIWISRSNKKDKWNTYAETTKTLKRAESFLDGEGVKMKERTK